MTSAGWRVVARTLKETGRVVAALVSRVPRPDFKQHAMTNDGDKNQRLKLVLKCSTPHLSIWTLAIVSESDRLLHSRPARLSRAPIRGRMGITGFRHKVRTQNFDKFASLDRQIRAPGADQQNRRG